MFVVGDEEGHDEHRRERGEETKSRPQISAEAASPKRTRPLIASEKPNRIRITPFHRPNRRNRRLYRRPRRQCPFAHWSPPRRIRSFRYRTHLGVNRPPRSSHIFPTSSTHTPIFFLLLHLPTHILSKQYTRVQLSTRNERDERSSTQQQRRRSRSTDGDRGKRSI